MIQPPADLDDVTGLLAAILGELRGLRADIQQRQSSMAYVTTAEPALSMNDVERLAQALGPLIELREPKRGKKD